jgi:hypothetical protein
MVSTTTVVGLIAASFAVITIGGRISSSATISAPVAKAQVIRVTGQDFKFDAPDVIPSGLIEFRFLNKGPSLHHMSIVKLAGGKTVDDLSAALSKPGPPPFWVESRTSRTE